MNFRRKSDDSGHSVLELRPQTREESDWLVGFLADTRQLELKKVNDTWRLRSVDVNAASDEKVADYRAVSDADIETELAESGVQIDPDAPRDEKIKAHLGRERPTGRASKRGG